MLFPVHKTNRSPSAERQPSSEPWTRPRQTNWNVDCEVIHNIYMEKKKSGKIFGSQSGAALPKQFL